MEADQLLLVPLFFLLVVLFGVGAYGLWRLFFPPKDDDDDDDSDTWLGIG